MIALLFLSGCFQTKQEKHEQFIQAIQKGDLSAVRNYIETEKEINFQTKNGTPLDIAMKTKHKKIVVELLRAGAKSAYMPLPPLSFTIASMLPQSEETNKEIVKQMMNKQTVKERDKDGNTPLHYAIDSGDIELVRLLVACAWGGYKPCGWQGGNSFIESGRGESSGNGAIFATSRCKCKHENNGWKNSVNDGC